MNVERLMQVLEGIQGQIRFSDTKAQIVLGIDGILAGILGTQVTKLASVISLGWPATSAVLLSLFGTAYLVALSFSLGWAFRTVYPRLKINLPESRIFFAHIAKIYGADYDRAAKDLIAMTDEELRTDAAKQILASSLVCQQKYECLRRALFWMGVSVACWVGTLVFLFARSGLQGIA